MAFWAGTVTKEGKQQNSAQRLLGELGEYERLLQFLFIQVEVSGI